MTLTADRPADYAVALLDSRSPLARVERLLDEDTFLPFTAPEDSGVVTGMGRIGGSEAVVYATDVAVQGGALGSAGCRQIAEAIDAAVRERCPVIGIWHSGGARLREGVESLDGVGRVFAAMVRASGRVPQLSVVLGPAAGGAAYGPALTDIVVMGPAGRVFVTGPEVVRSVTGEDVDMLALGGPDAHGRRSGVVHVVEDSDEAALSTTRRLARLLGEQGRVTSPESIADDAEIASLLPESARRAYDVHPLVARLLDSDPESAPVELHPRWARNIVTTIGRLGGRTVGVIANNPIRRGGCLDSLSAEKAARFVRMCDAFGVPLVVLVDVPGYLPGVGQEWDGVVRRGAKLLHAFAEAVVPRITVVTRKAYGGAYIAMNSRSLGATAVYAWPGAEVAVMGATAAVGILHRREIAAAPEAERADLTARLAADHARATGGLQRPVDMGVIDDVISPEATRRILAARLYAAATDRRGAHRNIPL